MAQFTGDLAGREVNIWLSDEDDMARSRQLEVAQRVAASLPIVQAKAADYLDMFVDRARASGNADEEWWLDEIDFREGVQDGALTFEMHFSLNGDDGGLWAVYMRVRENEDRPFRFERHQG